MFGNIIQMKVTAGANILRQKYICPRHRGRQCGLSSACEQEWWGAKLPWKPWKPSRALLKSSGPCPAASALPKAEPGGVRRPASGGAVPDQPHDGVRPVTLSAAASQVQRPILTMAPEPSLSIPSENSAFSVSLWSPNDNPIVLKISWRMH